MYKAAKRADTYNYNSVDLVNSNFSEQGSLCCIAPASEARPHQLRRARLVWSLRSVLYYWTYSGSTKRSFFEFSTLRRAWGRGGL
eukprot:3401086-Pleurochrysis_carterae.AAC.1